MNQWCYCQAFQIPHLFCCECDSFVEQPEDDGRTELDDAADSPTGERRIPMPTTRDLED